MRLQMPIARLLPPVEPARAAERARHDVWLFDDAPCYPGVTMMEMRTIRGGIDGTVTTKWYGSMAIRNARRSRDTVTFDFRNLNGRGRSTRRWTARFTGGEVRVSGD